MVWFGLWNLLQPITCIYVDGWIRTLHGLILRQGSYEGPPDHKWPEQVGPTMHLKRVQYLSCADFPILYPAVPIV